MLHTDENSISSNCTHVGHIYSWEARGVAAIPCLLLALILLTELLCDHRAYRTTLQRLILYYTLVSFAYQILTSVNAIAQHHQGPSLTNTTSTLESAVMYFANVTFILPAIIINFLMFMIMRLCCGCHIKYPPSKSYTVTTELTCIILGLVLSLIWVPFNTTSNSHLSFDTFYTVHASGCFIEYDMKSAIAQVCVALVIICEMVIAVIILNVAHCKIRLHVKGQQVLPLERKTHIIVTAVALIYAVGITVSFGLIYVKRIEATIALAVWFPVLNQCNLIVLYVTSIRTTNNALFCLQRKKNHWNRETLNTEHHKTNPTSHPLNQPSHTTFSPPYTNGFTHISETPVIPCDDSGVGEMIPLLDANIYHFSTPSGNN